MQHVDIALLPCRTGCVKIFKVQGGDGKVEKMNGKQIVSVDKFWQEVQLDFLGGKDNSWVMPIFKNCL